MSKKLIFFDIDGTLYNHETDSIPRSTIEALEQLRQNDQVEIVVATGRASFLIDRIKEIIKYFDAFIFLNGQLIEYKGKEIFANTLSVSEKRDLIEYFDENDLTYGYFSRTKEYISYIDDHIREDFSAVSLDPPEVKKLSIEDEVIQLYVFGDSSDFADLENKIPYFNVVPWYVNGADLLYKNHSKASAIKFMASKLRYDIKDTIAFGDAMNDKEMIETAGIGVAMGNGVEEVKQVANYVTDAIDDDGLYKALKHFDLI